MKIKDPWARRWWVYKGQPNGGIFLGPVSFTLKAVRDRRWGGIAFYRVTDVKPKSMRRYWRKLRLFPRGNKLSDKPPKVLPKWDAKCDAKWESAARWLRNNKYASPKGVFPGINPEIIRLEGDMYPKRDAEALTIVRVESAVEDTTDLLVLILKSTKEYSPREDGTAHGGGPPH